MVSKCPKGTIKRKSYTTVRRGKKVRVKSSCIKATSVKGIKRSRLDKAYIAKRERIQKKMQKKYGSKKCSPGEIERAGFTKKSYRRKAYRRKDGTLVRATTVRKADVPPVCVKDTGKPGKGKKLPIHLEKGVLEKYGYDDVKNLSVSARHNALSKAVKQINPLSLFRKLIIVSTMNRDKDPKVAKIFKDDAYWVREQYGLMRTKPKSGSKSAKSKSSKSKSSKTKSSKTKSSKESKSKSSKSSKKSKKPKSKSLKSKSKSK